ncbi:regulator of chromosome condensation 1/beta-lactamase-inhibitor protein II [Lineolata rhizophorae]|uniref:Regulator of chromosome condensation 1/beta-lactamase-inhibitor protein II n=1 Tax=Lineolata rhizophorae TaxID=578093 RepID=A0A6A6P295_9PEZI|nr:regulator of chromosome condensation 1/beta-lactamase-inhibitor protein II [Lineolata rhizophorae]
MPPKKTSTRAAANAATAKKSSAATKANTGRAANTKAKRDAVAKKAATTTNNTITKKTGSTKAAGANVTKAKTGAAKSSAKSAAPKTTKAATGKAGTKPTAPKTKAAAATKAESRKRKATEEPIDAESVGDAAAEPAKKTKRARTAEPEPKKPRAQAAPKPKARKAKVVVNKAPAERLHVFVCGEGSSGELGLGAAKNALDVKRPRLNPNLPADKVGVVQVAAGGMHLAALTHDNKILTWGVNDQGALGRDTNWEGGLKDMDAAEDSDSDSDEGTALNPRESTPAAIPAESFPEGTVFTQVAASDSATFALTDEGFVYGWGTFRSNEGIFGFTADILVQRSPMLIPGLKKVAQIACGANHVLALDKDGNVFAWGSGQQNQLGRRVVERTKVTGLTPRQFGLPRKQIVKVECGAYHSFAVDKKDNVYAWGLNNYAECGIATNAGEDDAAVLNPAKVKDLCGKGVHCIQGGSHHSIAVTEGGDCLVWGRVDGYQLGIKLDDLQKEDVKFDARDKPRILMRPTAVPIKAPTDPADLKKVAFATCGSEHSIAITTEGRAYSWGFSANYQTGLGTDDDVEVATLIDNTATRDKKLNWAGAGGQYSVFTAPAEVAAAVNGTTA